MSGGIVELLYLYDKERRVPVDARATMRSAAAEIERLRNVTSPPATVSGDMLDRFDKYGRVAIIHARDCHVDAEVKAWIDGILLRAGLAPGDIATPVTVTRDALYGERFVRTRDGRGAFDADGRRLREPVMVPFT